MDLGRWDEAAALAERVLATEASPVNLLTSQISLGLIRARRGLPGAHDLLTPRSSAPTASTSRSGSPTPGWREPRRTGSTATRRRPWPTWPGSAR